MKRIKKFLITMIRVFLPRLFRQARFLIINIPNISTWEYESCRDCGRPFHICWTVNDAIWKKVMDVNDDSGGSLCVDCFIQRAIKKGVTINNNDFTLNIFVPEQ